LARTTKAVIAFGQKPPLERIDENSGDSASVD
jgi:hypothetical protein